MIDANLGHGLTTRLINADKGLGQDTSVSPPIHQSVNFFAHDDEHLREMASPMGDRYYTRRGNPTSSRLAAVLADLEAPKAG